MADLFTQSAREVEELAIRHDAVLVAFSGGKDSLAVAELCSRFFRRMVLFHMELCPGMRLTRERLNIARDRWRCEVITFPSRAFIDGLKNFYYSDGSLRTDALPDMTMTDYNRLARRQTGIQLIANGARMADFRNRRQQIKGQKDKNVVYPISEWSKAHVLKFLLHAGIPIPDSSDNVSGGDNFKAAYLLWLFDKYPDDFRKLETFFPFIRSQVYRRDFFKHTA